jgi:hypothetical protein
LFHLEASFVDAGVAEWRIGKEATTREVGREQMI